MRTLAGSVALAVLLVGRPLAAPDAADAEGEREAASAPPAAAAGAAAPVPRTMAAVGSDVVAAPPPASALAAAPPPPITLVLNADLGAQRLTVIENGKTKYT